MTCGPGRAQARRTDAQAGEGRSKDRVKTRDHGREADADGTRTLDVIGGAARTRWRHWQCRRHLCIAVHPDRRAGHKPGR